MWETSSGEESTVEWGETADLGNTTSGIFITGSGFQEYISPLYLVLPQILNIIIA